MKKSRKKQSSLIYTTETVYDKRSDSDLDTHQIYTKIYKTFRAHVGRENAITSRDLFVKVYGKEPETLDFFKRAFLWNLVKGAFRKMRHDGVLFIVRRGNNHFVLSSQAELVYFNKTMDRFIERILNQKKGAREWVRKKKHKKYLAEADR